jgi:methyltransferase
MLQLFGYFVFGLCCFQRLLEVIYAARNTKTLMAQGAVEIGRGHYPVMIALHVSWLVAILVFLPQPMAINWFWLAIFVVLQALRIWVLVTLGPYWTTRIITVPNAPLVRRGPYRFLRHPNYVIVVGEILAFPLVYGEFAVALVFSVLNTAMLWWRIREEEKGLKDRRAVAGTA